MLGNQLTKQRCDVVAAPHKGWFWHERFGPRLLLVPKYSLCVQQQFQMAPSPSKAGTFIVLACLSLATGIAAQGQVGVRLCVCGCGLLCYKQMWRVDCSAVHTANIVRPTAHGLASRFLTSYGGKVFHVADPDSRIQQLTSADCS
jgi:hypothetical protein